MTSVRGSWGDRCPGGLYFPEPPWVVPYLARERGFTLLELLVLIVIVAVLVGMVVPSLSVTSGRQLADAAKRLVLLVNRGRQEAALGSTVWRLRLRRGERSYRFERRVGGDFQPVSEGPFGRVRTSAGIEWRTVKVAGEPVTGSAHAYLFPTGEQDPFRLTLARGDRERTVVLDPVGRARLIGSEEE